MPDMAIRNKLHVLYERWSASKDSLASEILQKDHSSSLADTTFMARRLFESSSHHVAFQSESFYQDLRMTHQGSPSARNMIDLLFQDLKMLRVELFTFGEHYLGDQPLRLVKISQRNLAQLSATIAQRIAFEENQLGPLLKG